MTRTERLLEMARKRGDRAAELMLEASRKSPSDKAMIALANLDAWRRWTEAELREAWGR